MTNIFSRNDKLKIKIRTYKYLKKIKNHSFRFTQPLPYCKKTSSVSRFFFGPNGRTDDYGRRGGWGGWGIMIFCVLLSASWRLCTCDVTVVVTNDSYALRSENLTPPLALHIRLTYVETKINPTVVSCKRIVFASERFYTR